MWVYTIKNLTMNILLCHILHIRNGDRCGTKIEIVTKYLSVINTVNTQELSSATKRWIYIYKESVHSTQVWIKFNASMNDMKENKIHTETKWFQRLFDYTIYQQEKNGFTISDYALSWLCIYFCVCWLTATSDLQDYREIYNKTGYT